jgi:DNA-binding transcriptional ArsR family regulator
VLWGDRRLPQHLTVAQGARALSALLKESILDTPLANVVLHPKRAEIIFHLMQAGEFISAHQLAKTMGVNLSLVEYHLQVLTEAYLMKPVLETPPK